MADVSTRSPDPVENPATVILDGEGDPPQNDEIDFGGADENERSFALRNGWVPRDQFRGPADEWVDAKQFTAHGRGVNKILKQRNDELSREVTDLKNSFERFADNGNKRTKRELDARLADALARRKEAISNADEAGVESAEQDANLLRTELADLSKPAPKQGPPASEVAAAKQWTEENPWYSTDMRKTRPFIALVGEVRQQRPDLVGNTRALMDESMRRAMVEYPELFGDDVEEPRARVNSTNRPSNATRKPQAHTYENMPAAERAACDELMRKGAIKKRETYVNNYDWPDTK